MRRCMRPASPRSWVTATTVLPRPSTTSRRISNTCSLDFESREPVGSSARMSGGALAGAGATAKRRLRLPAGRLTRPLAHVLAKAEGGEQQRGALAHGLVTDRSERPHRQHDVIKDGELRQQEVELEDEAERGEPQLAPLGTAPTRGVAATG